MKFSLSTREIPRADPEGFPERTNTIFHLISQLDSYYKQYKCFKLWFKYGPSWEGNMGRVVRIALAAGGIFSCLEAAPLSQRWNKL